ncbi:hypothetical protein [Scytonema sp. PRP1]|uniref:hypothetical protein n=1 Tax=Scytonema sp. PRP1 TaxID=3120513 RepID=UPI002FD37EE8
MKPEWGMTALLNCIDYKPHGRRTALLICVNLSQNPFNISFPGRSWKCAWGGAASKQGRASQWYSQSLTGNKAILKSRFQVEAGNALGAVPQVSQVLPPNRIPSQRLGTRQPLSHVGLTPPLNPLPLLRGGAVLAQDKTGVGLYENCGQYNNKKISFPGLSRKCAWGGAASKQGRASQWYSQSLTGNKANNKKKTGNKAR